jgi:hypothetical protein
VLRHVYSPETGDLVSSFFVQTCFLRIAFEFRKLLTMPPEFVTRMVLELVIQYGVLRRGRGTFAV